MSATKLFSWMRAVALAIPIFGLVSATQLGCEATVANDIGQQGAESNKGVGPYGSYGYGSNGSGYGYDDGSP